MKYLIVLAALIFFAIIYFVITFYKYIGNNSIEESINSEEITPIEENRNSIEQDINPEKVPHIENNNNSTEQFENNNSENNLMLSIDHKGKEYNFEIKLYDDITPLTCKNFRFIATKGIQNKTYTHSKFHRVIKGFMLQGGDIMNGDGTGSISIYDSKFEDENFIKKHDKPGLLSMANSGPNSNGSQFFITTVPTPHLDNKHVVFGEVISGLENLSILENCETDENDKPINPMEIKSINNV